jgi:hypothetical protein
MRLQGQCDCPSHTIMSDLMPAQCYELFFTFLFHFLDDSAIMWLCTFTCDLSHDSFVTCCDSFVLWLTRLTYAYQWSLSMLTDTYSACLLIPLLICLLIPLLICLLIPLLIRLLIPLLICLLIPFLITDPWLVWLLITSYHIYKLGHWVACSPKPDLVTFSNQSSVFKHLPEEVLCATKSPLPTLFYPRPYLERQTPQS